MWIGEDLLSTKHQHIQIQCGCKNLFFEARVTGRMVISKKKKSKSLGRVIKSLILDLTDMKHLDISVITSGLEFGQK